MRTKKLNRSTILLLVSLVVTTALIGMIILNISKNNLAQSQASQLHSKDFLFFGTVVNAQIISSDAKLTKQTFVDLNALYQDIQKNWHAWKKGGLLFKINQAFSKGESIEVPVDVANLIEKAQQISEKSAGYFNPAIGQLIALWGFHGNNWQDNPKIPNQKKIVNLLKLNVQMSDIKIKNSLNPNTKQLSSKNKAVQLDMGAIAKGYAVDLAIELFQAKKIKSALLNAGGDLRVLGSKFNQSWQVGLNNPLKDKTKHTNPVLGKIDLGGVQNPILKECSLGCAVATSGSDQRYFKYKGVRYSHLINPTTGYPASDFASVSVVYPNATYADAAATALFVAGKNQIDTIAKKLGISAYLSVDNNGKISLSEAMKKIYTPIEN